MPSMGLLLAHDISLRHKSTLDSSTLLPFLVEFTAHFILTYLTEILAFVFPAQF